MFLKLSFLLGQHCRTDKQTNVNPVYIIYKRAKLVGFLHLLNYGIISEVTYRRKEFETRYSLKLIKM